VRNAILGRPADVRRGGQVAPVALRRPGDLLLKVVMLLAVGLPLVACGTSGGAGGGVLSASPGLSIADRAGTAGVRVTVSGDVATAVKVGLQLAAQSMTLAQAQTQLTPVLAKITTAASQNASLPVGKSLQHLADSINSASQVSPTDVPALRDAATNLGTAGKADVLTSCAAAAR